MVRMRSLVAAVSALLLLASCENSLLKTRLRELASPAAPTGLSAAIGDSRVRLSWETGNAGAEALTYTVYYRQGASVSKSDSAATKISGLAATDLPYEVSGLGNLLPYAFMVSATNTAGEGAGSAVVTATPLPVPAGMTNLLIEGVDSHLVRLSWPEVGYASYYRVYYEQGASVSSSSPHVDFAPPLAFPVTVSGLVDGQQYCFSVAAVNVSGEGTMSYFETATPNPAAAAPTGLTVSAVGTGRVDLSWDSVPSATGYRVYYAQGGTVSKTDSLAPSGMVSGTTASITGLSNEVQHCFAVSAIGLAEGPLSAPVLATPRDSIAPAPGNSGTFGYSNLLPTDAPTQVSLSWTAASDDVTLTPDLQYKVLYSTAGSSILTPADAEANGIVGMPWAANTEGTIVYGLTKATTYYFTILVKDQAGNVAKYATLEGPARLLLSWVSQSPNSGASFSATSTPPSYDFGWIYGAPADATFRIANQGFGRLDLTNASPGFVTLSGTNPTSFAIPTQPADFVDPGSTSDFVVRMLYTATYNPSAQVNLPNSDPERAGFYFSVTGHQS